MDTYMYIKHRFYLALEVLLAYTYCAQGYTIKLSLLQYIFTVNFEAHRLVMQLEKTYTYPLNTFNL